MKKTIIASILWWFVVVFLLFWIQRYHEFIKYIYFLRVPIFTGIFLLFFPFFSIKVLPSMLKNLFVLRNKLQLIFVIVGSILTSLATTSVFNTILRNAHLRFSVSEIYAIPDFLVYIIPFLLSLPIIKTSVFYSIRELESNADIIKGVFTGEVISLVIIIFSNFLYDVLETNDFIEITLIKMSSVFPINSLQGYIKNGEIVPGIVSIIVSFLVISIIYFASYILFQPKVSPKTRKSPIFFEDFEAPALFYIMLILSIIVLVLGGMSFLFDYSRLPIFLVLFVVTIISYNLFEVEHYYKMYKNNDENESRKPQLEDWKQVIYKRVKQQGNKTLVVVNASGGGIQASGWTAQVLTGLHKELGASFTQSIGWISAVSGGSVGTMFYLDSLEDDNNQSNNNNLDKIIHNATDDCLDATGWGLAFPDLLRLIGLSFILDLLRFLRKSFTRDNQQKYNVIEDRGQAIETEWKRKMVIPDASLSSWRKKIEDGILPIPIFNATLVETGQRFLISPMKFNGIKKYNSIDFNTLYPKYTIDITTAARLSATFPYISPICRSSVKDNKNGDKDKYNYHFADGGYFDNSGVFTSVELLEDLLNSEENLIKKVIFLRINAFPETNIENNLGTTRTYTGWRMALLGSLLTLLNVRNTIQSASNNLKIKLLSNTYKCNFIKNEFTANFLQEEFCNKSIEFKEIKVDFDDKEFEPPLSWQLTKQQKEDIKHAWYKIKDNIISQIQEILKEN